MGRPKRIFTDKEQKLIVALYQDGKTDQQVADIVGMSRTTYLYALKTNRLVDTIKKTKTIPDIQVEKSLFKRCLGYEFTEIRDKTGGKDLPEHTETIKEVVPDTTACIYWLGNRMPKRWRNKQEIEHTGIGFRQIIIVDHNKVEDKLGKRLRQGQPAEPA